MLTMFRHVVVAAVCCLSAADALGCQSMDGKPVDWFIVYKIGKLKYGQPDFKNGSGFFYMDANIKEWTHSKVPIDRDGQAVFFTLQQIYNNQKDTGWMYVMYNDEPPDGGSTGKFGHTKGVVAFDRDAGFWLIHSVPKFPVKKDKKSYHWVNSAYRYGQSMLCVTYPYTYLEKIGEQFMYIYPQIYDYALPFEMAKENPTMAKVLDPDDQGRVRRQPWNHKAILFSSAKIQFVSFAKFSKYGEDLYSCWLAQAFESDLMVETWQHGQKLPSNCTGVYKIYNVKTISMPSKKVIFKETKDHSKWAISTTKGKWVCIGDINRQIHQEWRAGGTMCFQDTQVWNSFRNIIAAYNHCYSPLKWIRS